MILSEKALILILKDRLYSQKIYFKRKLASKTDKVKLKISSKEQQMREKVHLKMKLSFRKKCNFWKIECKNYFKLNLKQEVR